MRQYYAGKTVFITGATGFIGSVLLQTFLAKLPEVRRIYCLYRSQPGEPDPRVVWIKGDIELPGWGLEPEVLERVCSEVQVIFHLAAYTRWDVGLKEQVRANTLPVLFGAELATRCARLESLVVTSSYWAACHLGHAQVAETVFQDYRAERELSEILAGESPARLAEWPNAYSYSKNLAERLLHQRFPALPVLLARVTSACGAWEFPTRGFCRFDNALPAFLRAIVQGGVRYFPASMKHSINDAIPVDLCVNLLLANAAQRAGEPFSVIHCGSANRNLPTIGRIAEMAGEIEYLDSDEAIAHALCSMGNGRAAALNRLVLKTYRLGMEASFVFLDHQARRPLLAMTAEDRDRFPIDVDAIDWEALVQAMVQRLGPGRQERAAAPQVALA